MLGNSHEEFYTQPLSQPQHKTSVQKTSHDFQMSLVAFQRAQQVSAERQRTVVEGVKHAVEDEHGLSVLFLVQSQSRVLTSSIREERPSSPSPSQRQAQLLQQSLSPQELAYQESLVQEREAEIREIETGIHELHQIFRDLGTLVQEQGGMIGMFKSPSSLRFC